MSDFEDSDEERYANESFENETDNDVQETAEIESEASENSDEIDNNRVEEEEEEEYIDDDEDDLPSVKLNTGPIKRNSYSNNYTNHHKTDAVPFASSSDEENDVIVGQTLAEINTPSMHFIDEPQKPAFRQFEAKGKSEHYYANSVNEEELGSSDEISEEENDEDEDEEAEFKRIQEMEEKYMLQNSAKTPKLVHVHTDKSINQDENENPENASEEENVSDIEDEEMDEEEEPEVIVNEVPEYVTENSIVNERNEQVTNGNLENLETKEPFKKEKIDIIEVIENTITNLTLLTERNKEKENSQTTEMVQLPVTDENVSETSDTSKIMNSETTVTATDKDEQEVERKPSEDSLNQNDKSDTDDYSSNEQEQATEVERVECNVDNFDDYKRTKYDEGEADAYYTDRFDYRITSKTPSSFNSDDYIFHANLIKQIHRTNSMDKLRPKPHPRKSMSFSNDRMREIERHNQILLRKILTQKPTYNLKGKSSQTFPQKASAQPSTRMTTSAVNRKKQQRQIDMDNQILKRKIEAIAMRRKPLIS